MNDFDRADFIFSLNFSQNWQIQWQKYRKLVKSRVLNFIEDLQIPDVLEICYLYNLLWKYVKQYISIQASIFLFVLFILKFTDFDPATNLRTSTYLKVYFPSNFRSKSWVSKLQNSELYPVKDRVMYQGDNPLFWN
jgi:hypothetical protein